MEILEYYLTGGTVKMGRREAMFELLRKDSALRFLMGQAPGDMKSLTEKTVRAQGEGDFVVFDFSGMPERRLAEDPTRMLNELKMRYKNAVGGKLYFKSVYTTFIQVFYMEADLGAEEISLAVCE